MMKKVCIEALWQCRVLVHRKRKIMTMIGQGVKGIEVENIGQGDNCSQKELTRRRFYAGKTPFGRFKPELATHRYF